MAISYGIEKIMVTRPESKALKKNLQSQGAQIGYHASTKAPIQ